MTSSGSEGCRVRRNRRSDSCWTWSCNGRCVCGRKYAELRAGDLVKRSEEAGGTDLWSGRRAVPRIHDDILCKNSKSFFSRICQKRISVSLANPCDNLSAHFLLRSALAILGQSSTPGRQEEEDDKLHVYVPWIVPKAAWPYRASPLPSSVTTVPVQVRQVSLLALWNAGHNFPHLSFLTCLMSFHNYLLGQFQSFL